MTHRQNASHCVFQSYISLFISFLRGTNGVLFADSHSENKNLNRFREPQGNNTLEF